MGAGAGGCTVIIGSEKAGARCADCVLFPLEFATATMQQISTAVAESTSVIVVNAGFYKTRNIGENLELNVTSRQP